MSEQAYDCLIIGGGPSGLSAAIYLARFHLSVLVVDSGRSRAALIPQIHNYPGFPEGIAGRDLLYRMRVQAELNGAQFRADKVVSLAQASDGFSARTKGIAIHAQMVLLATGVENRRRTIQERDHHDALARGLLRYCPICDGYVVTDLPIAVIGTGERAVKEAEFLRSYTANLTLIAPEGNHDLNSTDRRRLDAQGIKMLDGPCLRYELMPKQIVVVLPTVEVVFSSIYPALGSDIRSELAADLGAKLTGEGCLWVDDHQRTDVPGLYAAGDVLLGLDQITHAIGEGAVAATTIRNDLAANHSLFR